jgi:hypothetical protein
MSKLTPKKVLWHAVKVVFVLLAGIALILSMTPFAFGL